jgi:hypothetical protein
LTTYLSQVGFFDRPLGKPLTDEQSELFKQFFEETLTETVGMLI